MLFAGNGTIPEADEAITRNRRINFRDSNSCSPTYRGELNVGQTLFNKIHKVN